MMDDLELNKYRRGLLFDPRTKIFAMITIAVFVVGMAGMLPEVVSITLAVLPLFLLVTSYKIKRALSYGFVFLLSEVYLRLIAVHIHMPIGIIITMCAVIISRMLPSIIMGAYLFSSTTVSEFIAAMERMHISRKISIPLSVTFRFFPTVGEEFSSINAAMRMRNIRLGTVDIGKFIEYRMIPLIVCSANIGNELSAAALTRGLSVDKKRTNICKIGFHIQDFVLIAICLVPYVFAVIGAIR